MTVQEIYERCGLGDFDEYRGMPGAGIGVHELTPWVARRCGCTHEVLRVQLPLAEDVAHRVVERMPGSVLISTNNSRKWPGTITLRFRLNPARRQDDDVVRAGGFEIPAVDLDRLYPKKAERIERADYIAAYQADAMQNGKEFAVKVVKHEFADAENMKHDDPDAARQQASDVRVLRARRAIRTAGGREFPKGLTAERLAEGVYDKAKLDMLFADSPWERLKAWQKDKDHMRVFTILAQSAGVKPCFDYPNPGKFMVAQADLAAALRKCEAMNAKIKDGGKRIGRYQACVDFGVPRLARAFAQPVF